VILGKSCGGDLELTGCEGVLGREEGGLGDLVESAIWIWMRCGFRRCWGDWKAIVLVLRLWIVEGLESCRLGEIVALAK
jgi:hypothetical protein